MHRGFRRLLGGVSATAAITIVVAAYPVLATTFGSGTYGQCTYNNGCSISLTTSTTVAVDVVPTASGSCSTQKDVVTVETAHSSGFTLTLEGSSASSSLSSGSGTIPASPATLAIPAALAVNTWGYRVDGVGGFGSGPTSATLNGPLNSQTFAGIPVAAQPDTIASTTAAASPPVVTDVWYSVCADTNTPADSYTSQVLYTAIVN